MTSAAGAASWNPCATCNCSGWCFGRCCARHSDPDADCRPGALCCPACPEQWHPAHPPGEDCIESRVKTADLPPLPLREDAAYLPRTRRAGTLWVGIRNAVRAALPDDRSNRDSVADMVADAVMAVLQARSPRR